MVADACTGSGAIAVALALEAAPGSVRVVATDCSAAALDVARDERGRARASATGSRWRGAICSRRSRAERVDAVVSNPPYVATGEWERARAARRDFEPREALDGGADGLAAIRALVVQACSALCAPAGCSRSKWTRRRARGGGGAGRRGGVRVVHRRSQDLFGRPRYVRARRPDDGSD